MTQLAGPGRAAKKSWKNRLANAARSTPLSAGNDGNDARASSIDAASCCMKWKKVAGSPSPASTRYQSARVFERSQKLAASDVLPAPGAPVTHATGDAALSAANRRGRATTPGSDGRAIF